MKKWQWILLAVVAYLLFLVAYTPASFVASYIQKLSDNKVVLSGVSGTLFDGSSQQVIAQGLAVNNVNWQLSPLSLLMLTASIDVKGGNLRSSNDIYIKGNISTSLLNLQNINAQALSIFVPTKTLLSQFKLPVFVTASGRFRVDINELEIADGCATLDGTGNWLNAAVSVNKKDISFGNFDAKLSCETPSFAVQILAKNKLNLDAKLTVDMLGKYQVSGTYNITPDLPAEIQEAARFFGKPNGDGVYTIAF